MKVKINDLPKGFKEKFIITANSRLAIIETFSERLGTEIIRDMTNMEITYHDYKGLYEHDDLEFKSDYEYTLFLLKFSNDS